MLQLCCALTTPHLATPASREDFISKRSLVMSEVTKLGVDDRVSVEDLVVNVLSWHYSPHSICAALWRLYRVRSVYAA
jgi:hypothetical protein